MNEGTIGLFALIAAARDFKDRMKWYATSVALNGMAWLALKFCDVVECDDEAWEDE